MSRTPAQMFGMIFGVVYIVIGIGGFAVVSGVDFAGSDGKELLDIFEVNPLHNLVHLLIGGALFFGSRAPGTAVQVNTIVGIAYLATAAYGFFAEDSSADILAVNGADHVLHLVSAALALTIGRSVSAATT